MDIHDSEDMKNLPDDPRLKCYFKCLYVEWGIIVEGDPNFHLDHMIDWLETLIPEDQKIYLGLGKGCKSKKKDMCEKMYELVVCYKRNDPVVSIVGRFQSPNVLYNLPVSAFLCLVGHRQFRWKCTTWTINIDFNAFLLSLFHSLRVDLKASPNISSGHSPLSMCQCEDLTRFR